VVFKDAETTFYCYRSKWSKLEGWKRYSADGNGYHVRDLRVGNDESSIETHDVTKVFKSKVRSLGYRSFIFERIERTTTQMVPPEILTLAFVCGIL